MLGDGKGWRKEDGEGGEGGGGQSQQGSTQE